MIRKTRYTKEMIEDNIRKGYWSSETFVDLWEQNASKYPDKEAIVDSRGTRLTWSQGKQQIDRLALGLAELGIERGSVIGIQMPDRWEYFLLRLACEKAGLISLSMMRHLQHTEVEYILKWVKAIGFAIVKKFREFDYYQMVQEIKPNLPDLKHVFVIGDDKPEGVISIAEMAQKPVEGKYPSDYLRSRKIGGSEIGLLQATTGTTGFPKLVQFPITTRVLAGKYHVDRWKITKDDVCASLAPLPGGPGGTIGFLCPLVVGAKVVVLEHYTPENALKIIQDEKVTLVGCVPSQVVGMLSNPDFEKYDLSSLRAIRCTGGPMTPKVAMEAEKKFKCELLISYGGSEMGSISDVPFGSPEEMRMLTVGSPLPGVGVKFTDKDGKEVPKGETGNICVRGPLLPDSYFNDPEATSQVWDKEGWVKTGDLGKFDEQGNIRILGREKDMIIRGGQNIYPVEIENLLFIHPKIMSVAVVGMPDKLMGEKSCAYVVLKPGERFAFEEMVSFLKEKKIAPYKLPERLEVINELPTIGGKIDKKVLRAGITKKLKEEGKID